MPYEEFKEDDPDEFKRRLRISVELFGELLSGIEVDIAKQVSYHCSVISIIQSFLIQQNTVMRDAISPSRRLIATLKFLATGADLRDISSAMRIHPRTISKFIPEVTQSHKNVMVL